MTTSKPRLDPAANGPRPRPSDERARLAEEGRTTRRIAVIALVLALLGTGLAVARFVLPVGAASCQQASWDAKPAEADLPDGYTLSTSQYDINRQQTTFLGPLPADETIAQGVVYVTVTCFTEGAADAVTRSEQAATDANQVVTPRDDLGDGGFSAIDETGTTFLQLRHGNVVAYLAASADVAPGEVDALASAYDKAMGGDGGSPAVGTIDPGAVPSDDLGSEEPLPSEELPSDVAAAPELEAKLPTQVGDTALTIDSFLGTDIPTEDAFGRSVNAGLRANGKTAEDLSLAQAYDETQVSDISIVAVSVAGLADDKLTELILDSWLSASAPGITQKTSDIGGSEVIVVDYGDGLTKDYVRVKDGVAIVLSTADPAVAEAGIAALP